MSDDPTLTELKAVLFARPYRLDDLRRMAIDVALERNHGNITKAAIELGVGRTTMHRDHHRRLLEKAALSHSDEEKKP